MLSVLLQSYCKVNTPDSQLNYTVVQLMPEYRTILNVETYCEDTVRRRVNYGNLVNMFVCRKHVADYSLSFTFPKECRPSTQVLKLGI